MKITFVLPTVDLSGGIKSVVVYAQGLQQCGHEVLLVSLPCRQPTLREQVRSVLRGRGWLPTIKKNPSHLDGADVQHRVIERCRPIVDADVPDADVVIATWWETAEWVAKLSESKGAKVYFMQHYEVFDYLPKERVEATYSLPLHKIAVAQWLVDIARNRYGDCNVSLVAYGVDTKQFYAPSRGKQSVPTVGMMYSQTPWKGCDISLKAFSLAREKVPNLRLVAFGASNPLPELPLPPGTEYTSSPPQSTIKDFYSKCDAWLFGSRSEGFGMPIMEAMACRTPVIGTPTGAAPEFLSDGAGILVNQEDPEDMARAIERICHMSDAQWRAMSDAAYTKIVAYTWDKATEHFEAALHTAINRWKKGEFSTH